MPSPILARADALMQRRRQQVNADDVPVLTDEIEAGDDIPVLLDIEPAIPLEELNDDWTTETAVEAVAEAASDEPPASMFDPAWRDFFAHELARRVEQRISAELPRMIESTVRDFLAEQAMISTRPRQD